LSSVRKHQAYSHVKKGWEQFTDAVIKTISQKEGVVFLLWGNSAPEKSRYCRLLFGNCFLKTKLDSFISLPER